MIEALHFKDQKTDKFWFVETLVCEMMVNYGKTGTTGKYKIKEFDRNNRYYFDDEEHGLSRLIWKWDKEEATYYIETMRKDLIKYKEDFLN
ncbi:WGR domain-containing protein [Fusobacterium polymorphum]